MGRVGAPGEVGGAVRVALEGSAKGDSAGVRVDVPDEDVGIFGTGRQFFPIRGELAEPYFITVFV